jgi:hypothetical protein
MKSFKSFYLSEVFEIKLTDEIARWALNDTSSWDGFGDYGYLENLTPNARKLRVKQIDKEAIDAWKKRITENQLDVPYPKGFKDMPDVLPICRIVYLESPKKLDKQKLGNHWFPSKNMMKYVLNDSSWGAITNIFGVTVEKMDIERKETDTYLISAQIDPKYIGIKETLAARTDRSKEFEIFIPDKNQNKIKILKLEKYDIHNAI